MSPEQIRLECLRLAHRHDRQPSEVIVTAKEYEAFVSGDTATAPSAAKAKGAGKKSAT